mgnify:FL=1
MIIAQEDEEDSKKKMERGNTFMIPRKMQRVSLNLKPVVKNNKVAIPHIVHEEEDSEDDSPDSPLRN